MRCRIAYEHVAEGSTVIDGNADADGITVRVNHRCQMAGRVLPVRYSLFGNSIGGRDGEHRQVGAEAVGVYPYPADNSEGVLSRLFLRRNGRCLWYATMISEDRNADFRYGSIV